MECHVLNFHALTTFPAIIDKNSDKTLIMYEYFKLLKNYYFPITSICSTLEV